MSIDNDLRQLRDMLNGLIIMIAEYVAKCTDPTEKCWAASAAELPRNTVSMIDNFLDGDSRIPARNILQKAASDSRGFSEIGAAATEKPGPIYDRVEEIRRFASVRLAAATP